MPESSSEESTSDDESSGKKKGDDSEGGSSKPIGSTNEGDELDPHNHSPDHPLYDEDAALAAAINESMQVDPGETDMAAGVDPGLDEEFEPLNAAESFKLVQAMLDQHSVNGLVDNEMTSLEENLIHIYQLLSGTKSEQAMIDHFKPHPNKVSGVWHGSQESHDNIGTRHVIKQVDFVHLFAQLHELPQETPTTNAKLLALSKKPWMTKLLGLVLKFSREVSMNRPSQVQNKKRPRSDDHDDSEATQPPANRQRTDDEMQVESALQDEPQVTPSSSSSSEVDRSHTTFQPESHSTPGRPALPDVRPAIDSTVIDNMEIAMSRLISSCMRFDKSNADAITIPESNVEVWSAVKLPCCHYADDIAYQNQIGE